MAMRLIAGSASIGIPNWCRSAWSASDGYDVAEYESSQHHDTTRYWRHQIRCKVLRALPLEQLVKSDRQLADTPTGRVEDCIGDSRAHAGNADFADPMG